MTSGKLNQKTVCSWDFSGFLSQVQSGVESATTNSGPGNSAEHGLVGDEGDKVFRYRTDLGGYVV